MRFYYRTKIILPDADDYDSITDDMSYWGVDRNIKTDSGFYEDKWFWLLTDEKCNDLTRAEADEMVARLNKTLDESEPPFTAVELYQWETNRLVETGITCGKLKLEIQKLQQRLENLETWIAFKQRQLYPKPPNNTPTNSE
jgi:hypothetical protein